MGGSHVVNCKNSLVLPFNTLYLAIEKCNDIVVLSKLQCLSHLNDLKECHMSKSNTIEYIVGGKQHLNHFKACLVNIHHLVDYSQFSSIP